jgi:hypothetical protein
LGGGVPTSELATSIEAVVTHGYYRLKILAGRRAGDHKAALRELFFAAYTAHRWQAKIFSPKGHLLTAKPLPE